MGEALPRQDDDLADRGAVAVILARARGANFPRKGSKNFTQYSSERPEITSHDEEPNKAKTTKGKIESTKGEKMNLKKQIAVIVLALTATTSPVWSQDRQAVHITDRP